ncbi:MAG: UDP-N-acetylglucosamine 1-carboxyvinyltransferase [Acidobacteriota bacterium]
MDRFRIVGPTRITGRVEVAGAKNAALPALAASLLTTDTVELSRLPQVRDIRTMQALLQHLGVEIELANDHVRLRPTDRLQTDDAPYELVKTMRASVLVLQHLAGLEALGAQVELDHGYVTARARQLVGARYRFATATVTGTENMIMASVLARGASVLENCAREPEIIDLSNLLNAMGARISGAGSEVIEVEGVQELGGARHRIISDRIEAGTYLIAAAITAGDLTVDGADKTHLAPLLEKLDESGCELELDDDAITLRRSDELRPRDLVTAPYPGFPTDLQAQYMALMTQAVGHSTVCETVFENRFQHVSELTRMGADIHIEGSFARVHGPASLSGATVMATDLRASASLVLAGLAAAGETIIDRIYHLDRGYEQMEIKLQQLGARVQRIESRTAAGDENRARERAEERR